MTIKELWEKYLLLPNWKKFLLSLPLVVMILALIFVWAFKNAGPLDRYEEVIDTNKDKTDDEVKETKAELETIKEEVEKIDVRRQELKGQLDETQEEYTKFASRIDNASNDDELVRIAADLRAAASSRKRRVQTRP